MVEIGLSWVVLAGVYLALAGALSADELGAAAFCGGLGAVWVYQIRRIGDYGIAIRFAALKPLLAALGKLPGQTWHVGSRLLRAVARGDVAGRDRSVPPSEAGQLPLAGDGPQVAGARAVAVLATSLSPDTYVLRLERERGRVHVHAILPTEGRA